jgi:hypothetical protein
MKKGTVSRLSHPFQAKTGETARSQGPLLEPNETRAIPPLHQTHFKFGIADAL